jgi:hypothetical protein
MANMSRGRVQWVDAVTKQGKTFFIVNMHQATAAYVELQELVWRAIGAKIQERSKQAGMIVGDLNAGWPGRRVGYAESTAKSLSLVDEQLRTLVEEYHGTLISTKTASRVNVHEGLRAKLDHIIIWEMVQHEEWGSADWAGAAEDDHARSTFRVGEELLGPRRLDVRQQAEDIKSGEILQDVGGGMNVPKGQSKFTGKIGAPVEQKGQEWKAPVGWVLILKESEEQSRIWRERKELTESVGMNTTMTIDRGDVAILRIKTQQGHEVQLSETIQEAGESWRKQIRAQSNSQEFDHEAADLKSNTGFI